MNMSTTCKAAWKGERISLRSSGFFLGARCVKFTGCRYACSYSRDGGFRNETVRGINSLKFTA